MTTFVSCGVKRLMVVDWDPVHRETLLLSSSK